MGMVYFVGFNSIQVYGMKQFSYTRVYQGCVFSSYGILNGGQLKMKRKQEFEEGRGRNNQKTKCSLCYLDQPIDKIFCTLVYPIFTQPNTSAVLVSIEEGERGRNKCELVSIFKKKKKKKKNICSKSR